MSLEGKKAPIGTIAHAHTHPVGAGRAPEPSQFGRVNDKLAALRLGIPLYTVSNKGIWKVTPEGVISMEEGPEWMEGLTEENAKEETPCP
jgi:hypothetical protein